MNKAISPTEILTAKRELLSDKVIKAINDLIAINWDGTQALFRVEEITKLSKETFVFANYKPLYEEDWEIYYDGPSYNETWYSPTVRFKKKWHPRYPVR